MRKTIWKMERYGNNMEKYNARTPLSKSLSLSAASTAPTHHLPKPNQPAVNSDASMTTQVKRVSCTTTMYVTTLRDCVTLCFPPVRISCLGYTLSLCATCSSSRRHELLCTQPLMQVEERQRPYHLAYPRDRLFGLCLRNGSLWRSFRLCFRSNLRPTFLATHTHTHRQRSLPHLSHSAPIVRAMIREFICSCSTSNASELFIWDSDDMRKAP